MPLYFLLIHTFGFLAIQPLGQQIITLFWFYIAADCPNCNVCHTIYTGPLLLILALLWLQSYYKSHNAIVPYQSLQQNGTFSNLWLWSRFSLRSQRRGSSVIQCSIA